MVLDKFKREFVNKYKQYENNEGQITSVYVAPRSGKSFRGT